jgi:choice-of-anchor B domain-containing protein
MYRLIVAFTLLTHLPVVAYAQCGCGSQCNCGPGCMCGHAGSNGYTPPEYGAALGFSGYGINMESRVPLADLGSPTAALGSAIWGWTDRNDPRGRQEYALFGLSNRTAFVNVTTPSSPVVVGFLPSATGASSWRELKTYQNHAFIVSDGNGNHGMQVFDLTRLRTYAGTPIQFTADNRYFSGNQANAFQNGHTIFTNEASGYTYVFGTNTNAGGVHVVDTRNPLNPTYAGGYSGSGYIHDGQVVNYTGPHVAYQGREILFAANSKTSNNTNDDAVQILDVTNKSNIISLGTATHPNARYIHQGWLTPDQKYFLVNDELDEFYGQSVTKTHVYDVSSLTTPIYKGGWIHPNNNEVIDHNLFIKEDPVYGTLVFSSNYTRGLRVLRLDDLANASGPQMTEMAWFDTYPADDGERSFNGQWGSYPFFESGTVIAGDRQNGLFVFTLNLAAVPEPATWVLLGITVIGGVAAYYHHRRRKAKVLETVVS